MDVCLTVNYSPWSRYSRGGQVVVHNLAKQLSKMGHRVFVVYTTSEKLWPTEEVNYEIIWTRDMGKYIYNGRPFNTLSVFRAVQKLVSRTHIDIIHGHADESALLPFLSGRNKPLFVMTSHLPYFPKLNLLKSLKNPFRLYSESATYLYRYALRNARKVFAVSIYAKNNLVTNLGLEAEKIEVVYNGFASEFFSASRAKITPSKMSITFFGRLEWQKGVDILLKSFALVSDKLKDEQKVHLNIIGSGPNEKEYERLTQSLGLSQKVSFLGWLNPDQLREVLFKTSLCVLPSRVEGFSLAVGEAVAAGVPVISTDISSVLEIITDGETGLLTPPENTEALAEKMLYAINNPSEMDKMALAGREKVRERFTWEKVAEKYCLAYEALLSCR